MKHHLLPLFFLLGLTGCSHLIFQPEKNFYPIPDDLGVERQDHFFRNADNLLLHGWFIPSVTESAKGTIFYLHGNAQNVSTHLRSIWWLPHHGYNIFMFDYRGYGRSQGEATLEGLHQDVSAAMSYVFTKLPINKDNVVIYGQSLGGALAITASPQSEHFPKVSGIIIEGAFTSYRRVAREALDAWWLTWAFQWPLSYMITDAYRPIDAIASISPKPILIIHGAEDQVINLRHGQELFEAAKQPKEHWVIDNAGHNNVLERETTRRELLNYLQKLFLAPTS